MVCCWLWRCVYLCLARTKLLKTLKAPKRRVLLTVVCCWSPGDQGRPLETTRDHWRPGKTSRDPWRPRESARTVRDPWRQRETTRDHWRPGETSRDPWRPGETNRDPWRPGVSRIQLSYLFQVPNTYLALCFLTAVQTPPPVELLCQLWQKLSIWEPLSTHPILSNCQLANRHGRGWLERISHLT